MSSLARLSTKSLSWISDLEFEVDGVRFECAGGDYSRKSTSERVVILKDRAALEQYCSVLAGDTPKNILEFGIFQGGSPALFSLWFDVDKFVGIDICEPVPAFDELCRAHGLDDKIRSYYRVGQTDEPRIREIVTAEFGSRPLDLIIDDASHQYEYSKRSFEIAFPLLRPGGTYVIEDWGWAHWQGYELTRQDAGRTPLSKLIMELAMVCASRPDLISEVRVFPAFAFIRKATHAQPTGALALSDLYVSRNMEILGAGNPHLKRVFRLIASRISQRARRRLARTKEKLRRIVRSKD